MTIAICDDEKLFCQTLKSQLSEYSNENNKILIDVYNSGEEFIEGVKLCNYDVVFLDLYMKEMSGFETAKELAKINNATKIIFLTSNEALVFDSFEYQPFYFLKKENYQEMLPKVMKKLRMVLNQNGRFMLDGKNDNESIPIESICYIMSDRHNIVVNTTKYCYEVRKTMTETEKELLQYDFVRIHKKYLVNLKYIKKVNMREETVSLINDITLDMSRRCKELVLESFKQYQRSINNI